MKKVLVFTHANQMRKADKLLGMFRIAKNTNWQLIYLEPETSAADIRRTYDELKPDGIILEGDHAAEALIKLPPTRIPRVFLDASLPRPGAHHTVESDAQRIAALAFAELDPPPGRETVFLSLNGNLAWSRRRKTAFARLCAARKVPLRVIEFSHGNPLLVSDGIAQRLRWLGPPLAAFAVNDLAASALYAAAGKCALEIPRDLKIVSVDNNLTICENLDPPLSSIEQDMEAAGEAAALRLATLMDGKRPATRHLFIPPRTLMRRTSSLALVGTATVNRALALIQSRADTRIRVKEVAAAMGKARRTAEIEFRAVTGKTIAAAIADARFKKVEELLSRPHQQLGTIANLCGWRSSTQLMRAFKARYGTTMSDHRARLTDAAFAAPEGKRLI